MMVPHSNLLTTTAPESGQRNPEQPAAIGRTFVCVCGSPVFFENSVCITCGSALGFEPARGRIVTLSESTPDLTREITGESTGARYRACANLHDSGCNWLIPADDPNPLCRACRLNRTIPDLSITANREKWYKVESAKRRLIASLLIYGLPIESKLENPAKGLAFDLLIPLPGAQPVLTGHEDGLITLNLDEADDSERERIRHQMGEPYRTLLGHLRHEIGHYYWDVLVDGQPALDEYRRLFGDERSDYDAALRLYYQQGPTPNWQLSYISAYSTAHPWEDWAESWAHYLHMRDTLAAASGLGLSIATIGSFQGFDSNALNGDNSDLADSFLKSVNSWIPLSTLGNELARSMGHPDLYPFVLSRGVLGKLYFIHRLILGRSQQAAPPSPSQPQDFA